ncbi:MAG: RNA 3'-terminal phosphate cyclase/enolpyruvate transferase [Linnemannia elongata]|nr:MAG: RNA 3'-terminal phosphate cyclase/enolpyruvate transferase [Linnemannia elongata]
MSNTVVLDGTTLEGGGQILRIAVCLSAITKIPLNITQIRGNRPRGGGLKYQHLTGVNWLAKASGVNIEGAEIKSTELRLSWDRDTDDEPLDDHRFLSLPKMIDIGSPGSVALVLQAILPFIIFGPHSERFSDSTSQDASDESLSLPAPIHITIKGGTNVSFSPSFEYINKVLLPTFSRIGLPPITARLESRGWSTGGPQIGTVSFEITPLPTGSFLPAFQLKDRGTIQHIEATILGPKVIQSKFRHEVAVGLAANFPGVATTITFEDSGHHSRLYLLLVAKCENSHLLGRDWLYDRKTRGGELNGPVEQLVKEVIQQLQMELKHGGCVDEYLRDQLVIFSALAKGKCHIDAGRNEGGQLVEGSLHTRTAQWVASQMLPVALGEDGSIVEGIALEAGSKFTSTVRHP